RKNLHPEKAQAHIARAIARIHHVNKEKTDAYMEALLGERSDLSGLPFKMGNDCRARAERSQAFNDALSVIRNALSTHVSVPITEAHRAPALAAKEFWRGFEGWSWRLDEESAPSDCVVEARIAALMQVLGPQSAELRKGLVKYLGS